ncbi:MAG: Gfo/Idh/MocA family oxidoreductase [Spirochaetes bacterium]|nr:Gfo/Idh/MocA family oxidoreductase [Spirochaetota bacterium]
MKPVRIGIIGAGANTRAKHLPGFRAIPGVELVAVANRSLASAHRVGREFAIPRAESRPERIWEAHDIDAVLIGTWPYRHAAYACAALAHGKHVLSEARMAMDAKEAARMLAASRARRKLIAMVVPSPFTLAYDHAIAEFVAKRLGRLIQVDLTVHTGQFPDAESPFTWRHERRYSGNNAMTLGIYYEALSRWVGPAESVSAMARIVARRRREAASGALRGVSVADLIQVQGVLRRHGAFYRMSFSDASGFSKQSECTLHGSEAALRIPFDGSLHFVERGDPAVKKLDYTPGPAWRVEAEFIGAIRGEEPVRHTTFQDGLDYMRWTDAVHLAAQSGKTLTLSR